jgi:predicted GIY-YIG superfamily endonuclease
MRRYYVYILASKFRVLYVGITNDIWRRREKVIQVKLTPKL